MNDTDRPPLCEGAVVLTGAASGIGGAYCGRLLSLGGDASSIWGTTRELGSAVDQDGWSAVDLQQSIDRIAGGDANGGSIVWN